MTGQQATGRFRLFVAITVPDAVREEVLRVQGQLQPLVPHGVVRWTKPEQFHLTLRFLGDVPAAHIGSLQESIRAACTRTTPLHLYAQNVGFFPNAHSPRVIWVGIHDRENRLVTFQKQIEGAVRSYTAERGGEQFAGHITLGRFKQYNHLAIRELVDRADAIKSRLFGEWTARNIEIIRSELQPAGSRYASLAACALGTMVESG
jgi:2'-5' RNA ligase